eukprot:TRINITY_DN9015_c0_g1_i1.p1 TRINITY_DN9015_c0_g1~~TRINITY_DN9015_c0_g1_i1.p1  ORF type:complete len:674 (-),score=122.26 TRINITY_DN9015_c0_g1_i1:76-2097(-)
MTHNTMLAPTDNDVVLDAADLRVLSTDKQGDTFITARRMTLTIGDTLLLDGGDPGTGVGGSLTLLRGHRYGLVGENGAGKTTLMRALRQRCAEAGLKGCVYVGQTDGERAAALGDEATVLEHCMRGNDDVKQRLEAELTEMERDDGKSDDDTMARRMEELCEALEALEVPEQQALDALKALGFSRTRASEQRVDSLSGGWRSRLELARAIAQRPRLLFLDEPTNHLDLRTVLRLAFLLRGDGSTDGGLKDVTVVVVSHDSAFLDLVATDMLVMSWQRLQQADGGFSQFEEAAEQYKTAMEHRYSKRMTEEKRQKSSSDKARKTARRTGNDKALKQVASKERKAAQRVGLYREDGKRYKLNSLKKLDVAYLRLPARAEPLKNAKGVSLVLPSRGPPLADTTLLSCDGVSLSYGSKCILHDVTCSLSPGDRVALVGENGAGKSTLVAALAGLDNDTSGSGGEGVTSGTTLRVSKGRVHRRGSIAVLDQNQLAALDGVMHLSALELMVERHGALFEGKQELVRKHLAQFGISGDVSLVPIAELSGGLRVRVLLADTFAVNPTPSVLLLDEPTNHLDADTLNALAGALRAFRGAVVAVSHSIAFLLEVSTELWICRKGGVMERIVPAEGAFGESLLAYSKSCVPRRHHEVVETMMTARAARGTISVQQQMSVTSLLV